MKTWNRRGLKGPPSGKLGYIPFFTKWNIRRKMRSLERKADALGKRLCDLADQAKEEKAKAANVFVTSEYNRLTESLDEHFESAGKCAEVGGERPGRGETKKEVEKVSREVKKACVGTANAKVGVDWKSGTGHGGDPKYDEWEKARKECLEKGTIS